ncbi:hypothetical protein L7F22_007567 [Adiantum nelumboides]|nr:hypothetical protein [Adiantum nelumboides]
MAYQLKLPNHWLIHNAFHVSLLKPYKGEPPSEAITEDSPKVEDQEEVLQPESILRHEDKSLQQLDHLALAEFAAASTPEWKRVDLNGEANGDDDDGESDGGILAALEDMNGETMTNDDVLGDPIPGMQQLDMQRTCYYGLQINPPTGTNYLHFRYHNQCHCAVLTCNCLGNRSFIFEEFRCVFLSGYAQNVETHQRKRRYLIYDIMMLNHESLVQLPFHERWKKIQRDVIEPRAIDRQSNTWYCYEAEPFTVRRKDFWLLSTTEKLLHGFIKCLSHEADGLIFQGWDDPYLARTNESLLKWKYAHMNSVDFKFQVSADGSSQQLFLIDRNKLWPLEGAAVVFPGGEDPSTLSGKIIECSWLPNEKKREYMRVRTDKETPNAVRTYRKVMESIEDNITEEVLLSEIHEILHLPMYRERIQQEQRKIAMR